MLKWTHRELRPDFRHARPASSCWTMSPSLQSRRKPWDSNPQSAAADTCFQDRLLIQPDDFQVCDSSKFRGLESNQRPLGSEPSVTTSSNCPGAKSIFKTNGGPSSSGRRGRTFVSWFKARQPTASRSPITFTQSALRESNPPFQFGRLTPLPLGQGHIHSRRKERESNPQGSSLDCFRDSCHRPLACPSELSCGGRNRTGEGTINPPRRIPTQAPPQ
jgi:hypothetical protein